MPRKRDPQSNVSDDAHCSKASFTDCPPDPDQKPIPTIPLDYSPPRFKKLPTGKEKDLVRLRINKAQDLAVELKKMGLLYRITHLIALNLHYKVAWEQARDKRTRSKDRKKKTVGRWENDPHQKFTREKQFERFKEAAIKWHLAEEENRVVRGGSKKRPYYDRLLYDLWRMFEPKTDRPYRYIGALVNLFNLHPESFCFGCPRYKIGCPTCGKIQIAKKTMRKCSCGKRLDNRNAACSTRNIFLCPKKGHARIKAHVQLGRSKFRSKILPRRLSLNG